MNKPLCPVSLATALGLGVEEAQTMLVRNAEANMALATLLLVSEARARVDARLTAHGLALAAAVASDVGEPWLARRARPQRHAACAGHATE